MTGEWSVVYETYSRLDADTTRAVLEASGFDVWEGGDTGLSAGLGDANLTGYVSLSVPADQAEAAREVLAAPPARGGGGPVAEAGNGGGDAVEQARTKVLALRSGHQVAACKYCGIPTLDLSEAELENRDVLLLRAAGLGVNSAAFSDFEPGERICTDCSAHEVVCDLCGRQTEGFLDGGLYRRAVADEDEAYLCARCIDRLTHAVENDRDW